MTEAVVRGAGRRGRDVMKVAMVFGLEGGQTGRLKVKLGR